MTALRFQPRGGGGDIRHPRPSFGGNTPQRTRTRARAHTPARAPARTHTHTHTHTHTQRSAPSLHTHKGRHINTQHHTSPHTHTHTHHNHHNGSIQLHHSTTLTTLSERFPVRPRTCGILPGSRVYQEEGRSLLYYVFVILFLSVNRIPGKN